MISTVAAFSLLDRIEPCPASGFVAFFWNPGTLRPCPFRRVRYTTRMLSPPERSFPSSLPRHTYVFLPAGKHICATLSSPSACGLSLSQKETIVICAAVHVGVGVVDFDERRMNRCAESNMLLFFPPPIRGEIVTVGPLRLSPLLSNTRYLVLPCTGNGYSLCCWLFFSTVLSTPNPCLRVSSPH